MTNPKSESALDKGKNTNSSGTLRFKQFTQPRPGDRIQLTLIKRKTKEKKLVDKCDLADYKIFRKTERYLDLIRELIKLCKIKVAVVPVVFGIQRTIPPKMNKRTGEIGNPRMTRDYSDSDIDQQNQSSEEGAGIMCNLLSFDLM